MKIFINDTEAIFLKRPNRFIIHANIDGIEVICHCPNTGRMGELLLPGVKIILEKSHNPGRKTAYSVVAVYKGSLIVPIASVRANRVAAEIIIPSLFDNPIIRSEVTYGESRFDFLVEEEDGKTFIEVKSCTLFDGDRAIFPDAPTTRGLKHINGLDFATTKGYKAMVIFVVFNPHATTFSPNYITDPKFAQSLEFVSSRVKIIPFKVGVEEDGNVVVPNESRILPVVYK